MPGDDIDGLFTATSDGSRRKDGLNGYETGMARKKLPTPTSYGRQAIQADAFSETRFRMPARTHRKRPQPAPSAKPGRLRGRTRPPRRGGRRDASPSPPRPNPPRGTKKASRRPRSRGLLACAVRAASGHIKKKTRAPEGPRRVRLVSEAGFEPAHPVNGH